MWEQDEFGNWVKVGSRPESIKDRAQMREMRKQELSAKPPMGGMSKLEYRQKYAKLVQDGNSFSEAKKLMGGSYENYLKKNNLNAIPDKLTGAALAEDNYKKWKEATQDPKNFGKTLKPGDSGHFDVTKHGMGLFEPKSPKVLDQGGSINTQQESIDDLTQQVQRLSDDINYNTNN